ncbi:hypothetical protein [Tuwongella immobilis]|uniref:Uncharacterized protein n=1 Tax=Tuwongella immobilis TaxID=692036 RepID=A0A6C2YK68_9BACT|nr:hypothetical protein [Tuwongella immobilis]VIP01764.1 unnamed protein product [Tuwongella immobilis]VTR99379.1 unnamed protein product [Tuwongella immobilis]
MAKKSLVCAAAQSGLHVAVENEDWVGVRGTPAELEQLGRLLIEFARSVGPDYANLDAPGPLFRDGSLGITLYRVGLAADAEPGAAPDPAAG